MADWNELLPFEVSVKEGSKETGPPFLNIEQGAALDDGRTVTVYLIPEYDNDGQTVEGYDRCYAHACRVRDLLNEKIAKVGITA
ncbi:MAG: hypothetical protein OXG35_31720, partial [Acidobacteria bacterium]|nr:hypothetical protein [Acidobacteriota bacterium]